MESSTYEVWNSLRTKVWNSSYVLKYGIVVLATKVWNSLRTKVLE